jgi:long-subunit fatty acid transport protein
MKRYLTFITLSACAILSAQNTTDVLRYSTEDLQGTARFQGMGGAFGALGGDLSALNINPAGAAVFSNSLFTLSATAYNTDNVATYFNTASNASNLYVDINQAGGVMVLNSSNPDSPWNKITVAANYDVTQSFDNDLVVAGNSTQGIDNYFLEFAQGVPFGSILLQEGEFIEDAYLDIGAQQGYADQQAFLGYYGGLIDPAAMEDSNTVYNSTAGYSTVNQNFARVSNGYNTKFTLNVASQYRQKLNLGASINIHNILYDRYDEFTETGYEADSQIQRTTFDNYLSTVGTGFSFNLGAIAKLNEVVRLGASYQSPTWYRLEDNLSQRISSDLADEDIDFINFDVVNLFPVYRIKTPAKFTGSAAVVFGKNGLLSLDYGYQDMSQAKLSPESDSNFANVNSGIANTLGAVSSIRIGGEYRIERFSLRGGYRYEDSPFVDANALGGLTGISAGLGYDFGGSKLDFAINRSERDTSVNLFDAGLTIPAAVNAVNVNATLSYTISF